MIICSCANVNDRKLREALQQGARTLADLQQETGVAMRCGRCRDAVCEEISNHCGGNRRSGFSSRVVQTA